MESILKHFFKSRYPSSPEEKVNKGLEFARNCSRDRGTAQEYNRLEGIIKQKLPTEKSVLVDITNDISPGLGHVDCMHDMFDSYRN